MERGDMYITTDKFSRRAETFMQYTLRETEENSLKRRGDKEYNKQQPYIET